jgi:tellurite methyltransferase
MRQAITGFHLDAEGDWVAELSCGHNQHVRHNPPFQQRPWVLTSASRARKLGTLLSCPPCDRAVLPDAVRHVRSSPEWDERTLPPGLSQAHQLAAGTWGQIVVRQGTLRFSMDGEPAWSAELTPCHPAQAIPPQVRHAVQPLGKVRFRIDFFAVDRGRPDEAGLPPPTLSSAVASEEGGDPACWAGLLCPECGAMLTSGGSHREGCSAPGR